MLLRAATTESISVPLSPPGPESCRQGLIPRGLTPLQTPNSEGTYFQGQKAVELGRGEVEVDDTAVTRAGHFHKDPTGAAAHTNDTSAQA